MTTTRALFPLVVALLAAPASLHAQQVLMMPDSTNNRVVTFNKDTGAVINTSYFTIAAGTTPVHAMQVGREIWISEQLGDKVSRYTLTGASLGAISGGLDNIRGMGQANGRVYVTNAGTANGAPGVNAVVMYTPAGAPLGSFDTTGLANSPFGILTHNGGLLVSGSSNLHDVHSFTLAGVGIATFHDTASISFAEQMDHALNGDVLVACFTTGGISRLNPTTGALISSFTAGGARGVHQLPNGNVMWTSGGGVFIFNAATGGSTNIYTGGGRYIDLLDVTPPSTCGTADFNGDGDIGTDQDIEAFFACLAGNCCATCFSGGADFNGDGDIGTDQDIESFFRVLAGGNC